MSATVYKLLTLAEWEALIKTRLFTGTALDKTDGYIHLSTRDQVVETARLHFKDKGDLKLVEVNAAAISGRLKYEPARDGSLFPHLYGVLAMDAVLQVWHLTRNEAGEYIFPDDI